MFLNLELKIQIKTKFNIKNILVLKAHERLIPVDCNEI